MTRTPPPPSYYSPAVRWLWSIFQWRWRPIEACSHPEAARVVEDDMHGMPFGIDCDECGAFLGCLFYERTLPDDFPTFIPSDEGRRVGMMAR